MKLCGYVLLLLPRDLHHPRPFCSCDGTVPCHIVHYDPAVEVHVNWTPHLPLHQTLPAVRSINLRRLPGVPLKLFSLVTHSIMLWNLARCMCSFRASVSLSIRTEWSIAEATSSNYSFVNFVEFWYRPAEAWCTFIVVMCDFIPAFFHAKSIIWATVVVLYHQYDGNTCILGLFS